MSGATVNEDLFWTLFIVGVGVVGWILDVIAQCFQDWLDR